MLGITNVYTYTYHLQKNGQVERYKRRLAAMLQNFVSDHQDDWDEYASELTYAYNCQVHRSTGIKPFDLVLNTQPPFFTLHLNVMDRPHPDCESRAQFLRRIENASQKALDTLQRTQARFKKDFGPPVRKNNKRLRRTNYVYIDAKDEVWKPQKLDNTVTGPFKVLAVHKYSVFVDQGDVAERISADQAMYAPPTIETESREPD